MILRAVRYSGPSATVRTLFGDLLQPNDYELLLGAATAEEVSVMLRTTAYASALAIQGKSFAFALEQHWLTRAQKVADAMPRAARELCLAYVAKIEVQALKTLVRGISRGVDRRKLASMLPPVPLTSSIPLTAVLGADGLEQAAQALKGTPYGEAVAEGMEKWDANKAKSSHFSLLRIESALERQFFARLILVCRRFSGTEAAFVGRLIGTLADATNVLWAQRLRRTFHLTPEETSVHLVPFGFHLRASERRALCDWTGEGAPPFWSGGVVLDGEVRVALMRKLCGEAIKPLFAIPFQAGLAIAHLVLTELELGDLIAIHEGKKWGLERTAIADRLVRFHGSTVRGAPGV